MYTITTNDAQFKFESYENFRRAEIVERALGNDYTIEFPDGEILTCKFKKRTFQML